MGRHSYSSGSSSSDDEEAPLARSGAGVGVGRSLNDQRSGGAVASSHDAQRKRRGGASKTTRSKAKGGDAGTSSAAATAAASGGPSASSSGPGSDAPRVSSISFLLHAQDAAPDEDELAPPRRRPSRWRDNQKWICALFIVALLLTGLLLRVQFDLGPDVDSARIMAFIRGETEADPAVVIPLVAPTKATESTGNTPGGRHSSSHDGTLHSHRLASASPGHASPHDDEDVLAKLARLEPPPLRSLPGSGGLDLDLPGTDELDRRALALLRSGAGAGAVSTDPEHQAQPPQLGDLVRLVEEVGHHPGMESHPPPPKRPAQPPRKGQWRALPRRERQRHHQRQGSQPPPLDVDLDSEISLGAPQAPELPPLPAMPSLPRRPAAAASLATAVPDLPGKESPGELSAEAAVIAKAAAVAGGGAGAGAALEAPHDLDLDAEADAALAAAAAAAAAASAAALGAPTSRAKEPPRQSESDLHRLESSLRTLPPIHLDEAEMRGAHAPGASAATAQKMLSPEELERAAMQEQRELEESLAAEEALEKTHLAAAAVPAAELTPPPPPAVAAAAPIAPPAVEAAAAAAATVAVGGEGGEEGKDLPVEPDPEQAPVAQAFPLTLAARPLARFFPLGFAAAPSVLHVQDLLLAPYCTHCPSRCARVVAAVEAHTHGLSPLSRLLKLRSLGESSPRFARGSLHLFLESVSHWPGAHPLRSRFSSPAVSTFLQGDAHLENFGVFHAPRWVRSERRGHSAASWAPVAGEAGPAGEGLVFDLNDFDAARIGKEYYVDLVRLAASVGGHMLHSGGPGGGGGAYERRDVSAVVQALARSYHAALVRFVPDDSELSYQLSTATLPAHSSLLALLERKARKKSRKKMLDRFAPLRKGKAVRALDTTLAGELGPATRREEEQLRGAWDLMQESLPLFVREGLGQFRPPEKRAVQLPQGAVALAAELPLAGPWLSSALLSAATTPEERQSRGDSLRASYYTIKSVARRLGAGLSSLGARRYLVLVEGPTADQGDDVLLDVKQQRPPEWLPFADAATRSRNGFFGSDGARVARAVHALSPGSRASGGLSGPDPHTAFLHLPSDSDSGSAEAGPHSFVVRARSPWKGGLKGPKHVRDLESWRSVADSVGTALAAAHARADDDYDARLVPHSFEAGFAALVPERALDDWVAAVLAASWAEIERAEADFQCWTQHVAKHPELQPDRDDVDDDDD